MELGQAPGRIFGDPVLPVLASGSSPLVTGTLVVFVTNCQGTAALARTRISASPHKSKTMRGIVDCKSLEK